ncbi:hypothetical protein OTK49_01055 [Vibrio coralliirubri]|uniref:hypothetical protein n=1 Tax=Vibrio coralliirubri TaxID=1516159 RepID=UPI0022837013|nr:hypothetical protein [Vibrio coralliirubri]MCY9861117.1 hypothetical protein [Vibrio coralliirubri]
MKLSNFVAFTVITYLCIAALVALSALSLIAIAPEFVTKAFNHGGFAISFLFVLSARSSLILEQRKYVRNRTVGRRLASLLSISLACSMALVGFFCIMEFGGYKFESPDVAATKAVIAFNVVWFFVMIGLVEIFSKFSKPFIKTL